MTVHVTIDDLLILIDDLGVGPIRDLGLLESAAHRPTSRLWGLEAYPSLDLKAAALLQSLVGNQSLVDGNTRLGWLATAVLYGLNGINLNAPDDPAYDLVIDAASASIELDEIADRLGDWH